MSKFIIKEHFGVVIDELHRNALKEKYEQQSMRQLAAHCEISAITLMKIRDMLVSHKLLVIEGERKAQRVSWNTNRCAPNHTLINTLYMEYIKNGKSMVKTHQQKGVISLERALQTLVKHGFTGEIKRHIRTNGVIKSFEIINLNDIKVED